MRNKRWLVLLLLALMLAIGFLPTKNIVKFIFERGEPYKPVIETREVPEPAAPKQEVDLKRPAKPKAAPAQETAQKFGDSPFRPAEEITEPPDTVFTPEPDEPMFGKFSVILFDAMENKNLWQNSNDGSTTSSIGLFRGIDGRALALFYSTGKNGWAMIQKKGDWDFTGYKGIRFACKVDGPAGRLLISIGDNRDFFIEKSWDKSKLSGSSWKIYTVYFEDDPDASVRAIGGKVNRVAFKMLAEGSEIKGRLVIDNLELLK